MKRPNILFILTDDQGAWAMHCAGNKEIITPNLDKIAEKGIMFDNFFCASPVCSPARASIVTGEVPSCHGVVDWLCGGNVDTEKYPNMKNHPHFKTKDKAIEYLEGRPSYVAELAKNGYNCALSGKWHLGNNDQAKEGFSKWYTIYGGGCDYYNPDIFENGNFTDEKTYITDLISDKAVTYLEELSKDDKPFYLSVHYTAPHSPWDKDEHPKDVWDMYENCPFDSTPRLPVHENQICSAPIGDTEEHRVANVRGYYTAITAMDRGVGKILEKLEETGKAEETIIIFTADNGMNLGHHGIWGKGNGTYPQNMYDESVKIPFIISAPFIKNPNTVSYNMRSHLDLFPTILDMANINFELKEKQSGQSFKKELEGETVENSNILIESEYGKVRMIRSKTHKLVCEYPEGQDFFFDLENDPKEEINLINSEKHADLITNMRKELQVWFDKYSREECDARKFKVIGTGQKEMCYHENAYKDIIPFYKK